LGLPNFGEELPHDLVHLVVEAMLGERHGIWARVAGRIDPRRINEQANRRGGKIEEKYRALKALDEVYLSEALANQPWTRAAEAAGPAELLASIRASAGSAALPDTVALESVAAVRERLLALRARWRTLVPRGALTFRWPARAPEDLSGG
jgi:hypothetical protein